MARYLSPAKIGLLVLIDLYNEDPITSEAILPLLSFITSHIMDYRPSSSSGPSSSTTPDSKWSKAERTVSAVITIKDFEKLLVSYPFLHSLPGTSLWDEFLHKVWSLNSLDALHNFFERLHDLLKESKVEPGLSEDEHEDDVTIYASRNSPFGVFIRRCKLEYQRLRFHDCTELWKDFVRYRQPTIHYQRRRDPDLGSMSFDEVLDGEHGQWRPRGVSDLATVTYGDMLTGDQTGTLPVSMDDVQVLLEFQIEQMQKYGNRVPLEIRHQFQDLLKDSFLVPSLTHYLSFLDSWRAGDYPTAFDLLHRFFDYSMQNHDSQFYQYALMNLAVLQADFGCHKDAVASMLETVSTARENRDMTCLNFALNWLYHFGRAHPDLVQTLQSNSMLGKDKENLAYLKGKAKELSMWGLLSSVLLSEAKLCLTNGDSTATAFESIVRSSQVIVEKGLTTVFGPQISLSMALWERLGLTHLSAVACEIYLRCHAKNSTFDDQIKLNCRLALLLSEKGRYDQALQRLESVEANSLRSWKPGQYWAKYRGIVKLKRDLHHNNLDGANQFLSQLLQSKDDDLEPDLAYTIDILHIDYLTRRGNLQDAFTKVQEMTDAVHEGDNDVAVRIRMLILKASLLNKCGRPQRGFSLAMRAANLSLRVRLAALLWSSMGAVCTILNSMREFDAACEILTSIIPRSLECESSAGTAELYSTLADANMGLAGMAAPGSRERTEALTRAAEAVQKSFDHWSAVEDSERQCELMAKKAWIMKLNGEQGRAGDYAAAYVALRESAEALRLAS